MSERVQVVTRHLLAPVAAAGSETPVYEPGEHFGIFPDYEHKWPYPEVGIMSAQETPSTLFTSFLEQAAKNFPEVPALAAEKPVPALVRTGEAPSLPWEAWAKWTWKGYYEDACKLAKAFIQLGVQQFGSVTIFGFNAPEWMLSALAAMLCGGKYVGIYSTDTPEQVQYKVDHSNAAVMVVDGEMEFEATAKHVEEMPELRAIVCWGMPAPAQLTRKDGSVCKVLTFKDCLELGASQSSDGLATRKEATRPGHAMGIIYTSGTTGNPKAVMVHHDAACAITSMASQAETGAFQAYPARILSYLPLSHVAGSMMDMWFPIFMAGSNRKLHSTIYFARPYDLKEMTLAARIQFVRPTVFLGVPRVYEKMQSRMMAVASTITGVKKSIATWAKGKGLEYCRNLQAGGSKAKPLFLTVADKLILSKARDALGLDQCKSLIVGAAPISADTLEYFGQLGMMIQNVYGMSESSGLTTCCMPSWNAFGTVGQALPGIEVKCFKTGPNGENIEVPRCQPSAKVVPEDCQGEICFRGRHIMSGYMANPRFGEAHIKEIREKNESTIDKDGWLHSGDKGCMDTNGVVRITGRYKELIIGAGGENIAPVPVEDKIKQLAPALSNVMMVGDNRRFNVAVVTLLAEGATGELPGGDNLTGAALEVNPAVKTISAAMKDPAWQKYIEKAIEETNSDTNVCQNNNWKIQKFAIAPRDFSVQTGEFTPTMKLKRSVTEEQKLAVGDVEGAHRSIVQMLLPRCRRCRSGCPLRLQRDPCSATKRQKRSNHSC
ncbi:ACSBG2 [Symbiodinium sp. CCMP2592]|nr:ACSBG2 [Symbiodinium sp. CCMP2592]